MLNPTAIGTTPPKKMAAVPEDQHFILSTLSPSAAQKRLAAAMVGGILAVYVAITVIPIKGVYEVPAFIPAYVTAMFVCDFITALLLYAQFAIVRSRATLVVASAYLFMALAMIPFILVFPNVFVPGKGLLGGVNSTTYVYCLAHAGFPLFVIRYAFLLDGHRDGTPRSGSALIDITKSVIWTIALVLAGSFLFIAGEPLLPRVSVNAMTFGAYWWYVTGTVMFLNAIAIVVLWFRQRVTLDLWLMVVMFLYVIEIPLTYYPESQRFSVAWITVRGFGILASSIVLMLLIHEIETLYARLLGAVLAQRREREARLMTGDAVAASIAHEVKQPLTAMVTTADAGLRFLDRSVPNLDKAKEAFKRIVADGHRAGEVVGSIRANFKSDLGDRTAFDINELIQEAVALGRDDLQKHRIVVQAQPNKQLPQVRGNRVQLQQVLLNLIMNAIDAMAAKDGPRVLNVKSEPQEGDRVLVSVSDTGSGISSQEADRMFNPLFTTKSDGMGMGLSICRAIIEAHKGRLWFAPNTPRGAVFQFTLEANSSTSAAC
jgi:signal transduction histidine kinase